MEQMRFARGIAAGLAVVALAGPAGAFTTKYYAWTTPSAECPTTSSNLPEMDDMLGAWSEKMGDKGWPDGGHLVDGNINLDRFCDPDSGITGCSDYTNGIDEADAVMIGIHGNDFGDHWQGLLRDSGTSGFSCQANSAGDLRAGDVDVDFLHIVSCHSLDDDNLIDAGDMMEDPADSPSNGRRLQLLTGFHGDTAIGASLVGDYRQVAKDGFKGSTGDAWMDNLYDGSIQYANANGTYELCPIAYSIGSSDSDCNDRLLSTGYGGLSTDPSSSTHWCATAYDGCDPYNETAFTAP